MNPATKRKRGAKTVIPDSDGVLVRVGDEVEIRNQVGVRVAITVIESISPMARDATLANGMRYTAASRRLKHPYSFFTMRKFESLAAKIKQGVPLRHINLAVEYMIATEFEIERSAATRLRYDPVHSYWFIVCLHPLVYLDTLGRWHPEFSPDRNTFPTPDIALSCYQTPTWLVSE